MDVASESLYLHGANPVVLLGETIGQNLDRTAARVPDNDALVSVHQGVRLTYAQFAAAVEPGPGRLGSRHGAPAGWRRAGDRPRASTTPCQGRGRVKEAGR
jgi:hypothetical protein